MAAAALPRPARAAAGNLPLQRPGQWYGSSVLVLVSSSFPIRQSFASTEALMRMHVWLQASLARNIGGEVASTIVHSARMLLTDLASSLHKLRVARSVHELFNPRSKRAAHATYMQDCGCAG